MNAYRRKPLRIPGYDYATPGSYFVTICANDRIPRLSRVTRNDVSLTEAGEMALAEWWNLQRRFPYVELDDVILMPDHMHAIIWLTGAGQEESSVTLGGVIQAFKSLTTNLYSKGVRELGWPQFNRKLWQPGYFEHIIRDDRSLERHREYIASNPGRWRERHGG